MNKEIVIVMGFPASGKTTTVQQFVDQGYTRLNRDSVGGSMEQLDRLAEKTLLDTNQLVLDNLYPSVESRKSIIALAKRHKLPIRCYVMETGLEDAQMNACVRMIRKTGLLFTEVDQYKGRNDPNIFPVVVIYKYRKEYEKPTLTEGFSQVVSVPFVRTWPKDYVNKAIILDYDGTLREVVGGKYKFPTKPEEIKILPNRSKVLKEWQAKGYRLLGVSNQSGIAKKQLTLGEARICFDATNKALGVNIEFNFCPHRVPPITCYCRKPNPGLGAWLIESCKLNPSQCIMVGDLGSDKSFAARCGFQFQEAEKFFA
jgi:HAD superfamily hydrolase (TIGR01662 family)